MDGFGRVIPVVLLAVAGCVSAPADRDAVEDLNQRQIETLQQMQQVQADLQREIEGLTLVERADVFVGQNEVVIHLYFLPGRNMSLEDKLGVRSEAYAIVMRKTGLPKGKIRLLAKKSD